HQPAAKRVRRQREDDRDDRRRLLGRRHPAARGDDDVDLAGDELGRDLGKALAAPLRPAPLDRDGAALDPAELAQPLHESGGPFGPGGGRSGAEKSDGRRLRLLGARQDRPTCRATEQSEKLAAPHSITSSARASSVGGRSRPSALAVLRLITSSNLVDCWTG